MQNFGLRVFTNLKLETRPCVQYIYPMHHRIYSSKELLCCSYKDIHWIQLDFKIELLCRNFIILLAYKKYHIFLHLHFHMGNVLWINSLDAQSQIFFEVGLVSENSVDMVVPSIGKTNAAEKVRSFFPETWLWELELIG